MNIQYKASLVMAVFSAVIVLLISVGYDMLSRKTIVDNELQKLQKISDEMSLYLDLHLEELVSVTTTLSSAPLIKRVLQRRNLELATLSDEERIAVIDGRNQRWREISDINDPFIQVRMTNPVAEFLKRQQKLFPGRYGEIFLTNRFGEMIATTGKLTTLAHSHKYWWQVAYDDGGGRIFLDDRGFDASVEGYVLGVVVPIKDENGIIGILKANVNIIGSLSDNVDNFSLRHPGIMQIVRTGGLVVSERGVTPLSKHVGEALVKSLQQKVNDTTIVSENNENVLKAFSSVSITMGSEKFAFGGSKESIDHIKGNKGEGWHVVISLAEKTALDARRDTTSLIVIIGVIFTLLTAAISLLLGKWLARPIVELAVSAEALGKGDLAVRAIVHSDDEIGSLAKSLNRTATSLQATMVSRDELSQEIEQRKTVERQLTQFKDTLDRTSDCIFIIDPETLRFSYTNQGATQQVGYSIDELLQMTPVDIKPEFDEPRFRDMADKIIGSPSKKMIFETVHKHKNGPLIPVEVSLQYIELEERHFFVAIVRDITQQKKAAQTLHKLNTELEDRVKKRTAELKSAKEVAEKANRAKGMFISNMSHEFRTPLNAVIGFSQLMLVANDISAKQREYLNIVHRSGCLQLSLINDVLAISKLEDGQSVLKPTAFDLTKLIRDVVDKSKVLAGEKNISFHVEHRSEIPQFICNDYGKIQSILNNVIDNAIKFTESGVVTLRIGNGLPESDGFVKLVFDVEDSGIGISKEYQERIFRPFFQIGKQSNWTGTGLGLTLVQRYLGLMGGEICVDSELGQGAIFHVVIPVTVVNEPTMEPPVFQKRNVIAIVPDGKEYRVLVVDDEEDGRILLQRILESVGFSVRVASDGVEAIALFKEWRPQMIWMDIHMPGMTGLEATRRIRELDGGSETTIAALTAFPIIEGENGKLPPELDVLVTKPFNRNELLAHMAKYLGLTYQYKDKREPSVAADEVKALTVDDLAAISDTLLTRLADAVYALDIERSAELAGCIEEIDPAIGNGLLGMINNLDFKNLQRLLRSHHNK